LYSFITLGRELTVYSPKHSNI